MHINDKLSWGYVSFYYSRENWTLLVAELLKFKNDKKDIYSHFLLFFGDERGEHIRLAASSAILDCTTIKNEITSHFDTFIENNPSDSTHRVFPYGKTLWGYHDNNTLVWNTFRPEMFGQENRNYAQTISDVSLILLDNDYSPDNFLTVGFYLLVQILKLYKENNISDIIKESIESISIEYEYSESRDTIDKLISYHQIEEENIYEVLDTYWIDNNDSLILTKWLSVVQELIENGLSFRNISEDLLNHRIGLNRLHYILIIELLKRWGQNNRFFR